MNSLQADLAPLPSRALSPASREAEKYARQLEGVEVALMEAKSRIMTALERELNALRALKAKQSALSSQPPIKNSEYPQEVLIPSNVVSVDREIFSAKNNLPLEAKLDPALEKATIEELNAALAAAFSQMSAQ